MDPADKKPAPRPSSKSAPLSKAVLARPGKATGPKTAMGKEASSRNALVHGLTARSIVIHGEDARQYEAFRERFVEEAAPAGPTEELLVQRIVECAWRLRRLGRIEAETFQFLYDQDLVGRIDQHEGRIPKPATRLGANVHYAATHGFSIKNLHRYEATLERSLYAALDQLRRHRTQGGSSR